MKAGFFEKVRFEQTSWTGGREPEDDLSKREQQVQRPYDNGGVKGEGLCSRHDDFGFYSG